MKTGLNCEQPFDEWSRDFEKNVTCVVVQLFHDTAASNTSIYPMVHEITRFILEEAGISPEMLQVFEFISSDDLPEKGGS